MTPSARHVATAKRAAEGNRVAEPGPCRPAGDPGLHFRGSPRWLGSRPLCHTASRASIRNPSISRRLNALARREVRGQLALRSVRNHVRDAGRLPRSEAGAIQSTSGSQGALGPGFGRSAAACVAKTTRAQSCEELTARPAEVGEAASVRAEVPLLGPAHPIVGHRGSGSPGSGNAPRRERSPVSAVRSSSS